MEIFVKKYLKESHREVLTNIGLLLLRLWVGLAMFYGHGLGKLMDFSSRAESMDGFMGMPGIMAATLIVGAEVFCAILIAIGLGTRAVAIPLVIAMLVAAFVAHAGDPFGDREMALFYGTAYLMFVFTGPGKYSLDHLIEKWRG